MTLLVLLCWAAAHAARQGPLACTSHLDAGSCRAECEWCTSSALPAVCLPAGSSVAKLAYTCSSDPAPEPAGGDHCAKHHVKHDCRQQGGCLWCQNTFSPFPGALAAGRHEPAGMCCCSSRTAGKPAHYPPPHARTHMLPS